MDVQLFFQCFPHPSVQIRQKAFSILSCASTFAGDQGTLQVLSSRVADGTTPTPSDVVLLVYVGFTVMRLADFSERSAS